MCFHEPAAELRSRELRGCRLPFSFPSCKTCLPQLDLLGEGCDGEHGDGSDRRQQAKATLRCVVLLLAAARLLLSRQSEASSKTTRYALSPAQTFCLRAIVAAFLVFAMSVTPVGCSSALAAAAGSARFSVAVEQARQTTDCDGCCDAYVTYEAHDTQEESW